jgi:hypothetical protein
MKKYEIAELLGIDTKTLNNWKENRPELHKIVMSHFEKENNCPNYENEDYMINEISNDLKKLPLRQVKIIFYTIKTKLAEMEI